MINKKEIEQPIQSFYISPAQSRELLNLAESLQCNTIPELFTKLIELGFIVSEAINSGLEVVMFNPEQTKVVESKNDKRVMFLFDGKSSYEFVNDKIEDVLDIKKKMGTANWGLIEEMGKA